ncbi:MAG: hypothetical protein RLZ98_1430 [Pseudomonadota bacterium]|jgi:uncharacterized membrane protein
MFELLVAAALAGVIYLGFKAGDLARKLSALETNVKTLEARLALVDDASSPDEPRAPAENAPDAPLARTAPAETPAAPVEPPPATAVPPIVPPSSPPSPPDAPPPSNSEPGLEERLGTKWAVYVGGIAITLGGIFLVKHAIDMGLLGPAARILLGLLLGAGLVAAGTYMRLRDIDVAVSTVNGAHVPSVLSSAGTVVLFATIYAAYALYGFLDQTAAFLLLGATGIATMLAAALHGPSLAGLGLAGSYIAPLLVSTDKPAPWALVIYLAVVSAAALLLARRRTWPWLTKSALAGIALWSLLMIAGTAFSETPWDLPLMVHVLVQSAIAAVVTTTAAVASKVHDESQPDTEVSAILFVVTALAVLTLLAVPYSHPFHLPFCWAMIALLVSTAWLSAAASVAFLAAGIVVAFTLGFWPGVGDPATARHTFDNPAALIRLPTNVASFLTFALASAALVALPAIDALWRRRDLSYGTTGLIALAATLTPLAALVVAYLRITGFGTGYSFSAAGALLAFAFAWLADTFQRLEAEKQMEARRIRTGAFAAAAIAALSIALVATLQHGYLTVALALTAYGTAYVSIRRDIPMLRNVVAALGFVVLARIVWDPLVMGEDVGSLPVLNWLLLGYGVPAACFAAAGHLLRKSADDTASRICDALAVLFTALLGFFEIRHFVHSGDALALSTGHLEIGLFATLAIAMSYGLWRIGLMRENPVFEAARTIASTASALLVLAGLVLVHNPAISDEAIVGGAILNTLLPSYLLPGLLALFVARQAIGRPPGWYSLAAASLSLALIFLYVTLEVRHAYHGAHVGLFRGTSDAEMWSYTIAWLLLAIVWLTYGLMRGSLPARAASGLLLTVTIAKVALFDLSGVTGVWRALSFLCLGGVLIAIGMVYQKLVFDRSRRDTGSPAETI